MSKNKKSVNDLGMEMTSAFVSFLKVKQGIGGDKYHTDGIKSFYAGFGSAITDEYTEEELSQAMVLSRTLIGNMFPTKNSFMDISIMKKVNGKK